MMEKSTDWFAAPEAIQAAWRAWKRRYGGNDRTSDAFVAGWHAANAHREAVVTDRLARIEALLTRLLPGEQA